jgi:hypothetical protein
MPFDAMNSFVTKPKCPSCGTTLHWGITTSYNKKTDSEVCNVCKTVLSKDKK